LLKVDRPCHHAAATSQFGPICDIIAQFLL
jgi:hypothetical protein